MIPVAIIFDNLGPYHIARLRAASVDCNLLAVEVAGKSAVYAWEKESAAGAFKRVTLFEQSTSSDVARTELYVRLERTLDEFKPGVVVVPGWASPAAWGAMTWCIKNRVPMVCMSESTQWDEPRSKLKEWIKRKLVGLFSAALVGGEDHADYLVKLGLPRGRIFLGYDAVDNGYFWQKAKAIRADAENIRKQYELPENYFLASARFVEKKNLPRLLEAYAVYRKSCDKPWALVLLGDGELRAALHAKCAALGLLPHVTMPGFKQYGDLSAYYALANAFIHSSTVEPWGLVVNEAMASGLPVLVSNRCGCARGLVRDGVNGFTFNPMDIDAMVQAMLRISMPDFPLSAFGEKSGEIIAQWCPERFAQGLSEAMTTALAAGPIAPSVVTALILKLISRR